MDAIERALKETGIEKLKENQEEAILGFLSGHDVFVCLPTGYGKSLIYGILSIVFDYHKGMKLIINKPVYHEWYFIEKKGSIVVCISPLASLMIDQKNKFVPCGIITEYVGESQDAYDPEAVERVLKGNVQLVFITPESIICNSRYRSMLLSKNI